MEPAAASPQTRGALGAGSRAAPSPRVAPPRGVQCPTRVAACPCCRGSPAGLGSCEMRSQSPAHLVRWQQHALGSHQVARGHRPLPWGCREKPTGSRAALCPFPDQDTFTPSPEQPPEPRMRLGGLGPSSTDKAGPRHQEPPAQTNKPPASYRLRPLCKQTAGKAALEAAAQGAEQLRI